MLDLKCLLYTVAQKVDTGKGEAVPVVFLMQLLFSFRASNASFTGLSFCTIITTGDTKQSSSMVLVYPGYRILSVGPVRFYIFL